MRLQLRVLGFVIELCLRKGPFVTFRTSVCFYHQKHKSNLTDLIRPKGYRVFPADTILNPNMNTNPQIKATPKLATPVKL